jgi:hypothetical protein
MICRTSFGSEEYMRCVKTFIVTVVGISSVRAKNTCALKLDTLVPSFRRGLKFLQMFPLIAVAKRSGSITSKFLLHETEACHSTVVYDMPLQLGQVKTRLVKRNTLKSENYFLSNAFLFP